MYIIYEGPSSYDSETDIVVIATPNSTNVKTGPMWQTWILVQGTEPHTATKDQSDFAVCGRCPLRPLSYKTNGLSRGCYVRTQEAPLSVYRCYQRGKKYQHIEPEQFRSILKRVSDLEATEILRASLCQFGNQ